MTVIEDMAQLVKYNSISGNKMNDVDVVYTMWSNLKKTEGMEVGQVGFYKDKEVRKIRVAKRDNVIINRLNKTKREAKLTTEEFRAEREKRDKLERDEKKKVFKQLEEQKKEEEKKRKEEADLRSYDRLMNTEQMTSNKDGGDDSDDFM